MKNIILFGMLFNGMRTFTGAFAILYMMRNGLTVTEVGLVKSVQALVMLLLDVPFGYFADKYSHKLAMILAALCSALWLFITGCASTFEGFLFAEIFNALSLTFISGAYNTILISEAKLHNVEIPKAVSTNHMWNYFGMFLFSIVGAIVADKMFRGVWYIAAVMMLLVVVIAHYVLRNKYSYQTEGTKVARFSFFSDLNLLKSYLLKNKFIALFFVYTGMMFNVAAQYWQVLFSELAHISNTELGIAFSLLILSQSLAGVLYMRLSRMQLNILLLGSSIIISLLLLHKSLTFLAALLAICLIFFLIRLATIFVESEVHSHISDNLRASFESLLSCFMRVLLLVMFPLSGLMIDKFGFSIASYPLVLIALICLGCQASQRWFKKRIDNSQVVIR